MFAVDVVAPLPFVNVKVDVLADPLLTTDCRVRADPEVAPDQLTNPI